jgi:hypothetical protein
VGEIPPREKVKGVTKGKRKRGREGRNKRQEDERGGNIRGRDRRQARRTDSDRDIATQTYTENGRETGNASGRERTDKQPFGRIAVSEVTRPFGVDALRE